MLKKHWKKIGLAIPIVALAMVAFAFYRIHSHKQLPPPDQADYLLVLGAKVKQNQPSLALQYRIDAAADYLLIHPETYVIAAGGQGSGEPHSEALEIQRGLVAAGIELERIILEEQSTSTLENIHFSKELLIHAEDQGIIVTSDFHTFRAIRMANRAGLNIVGAIGAKTPEVVATKNNIREILAVLAYGALGKL